MTRHRVYAEYEKKRRAEIKELAEILVSIYVSQVEKKRQKNTPQ